VLRDLYAARLFLTDLPKSSNATITFNHEEKRFAIPMIIWGHNDPLDRQEAIRNDAVVELLQAGSAEPLQCRALNLFEVIAIFGSYSKALFVLKTVIIRIEEKVL
jgi:hypothetical protein